MIQLRHILFLLIFLIFVSSSAAERSCERIVSLAPTVTETVFAVGIGERLVGVTTFCDYPEQAKKISPLGSYFDTNIEKALAIKTDLVIGLPESKLILQKFSAHNIPVIEVSNRSIEQIISSFSVICEKCGCQSKALELERAISQKLKQIKQVASLRPLKKAVVLIISSISRSQSEFYLSGNDGYYTSLLEALNISNAVNSNTFALPAASFESLIALNPDIVFTISNKSEESKLALQQIQNYLPKVKIIELHQDYAGKPGPRFIQLLHDMQTELNKE